MSSPAPGKATTPGADERLLGLARTALAAYDLPPQTEVRPIRLINNAVFEVVLGGLHLALRIHRPGYRTADHIRSELGFLRTFGEELRCTAIEVPRPIAARNGELLVRLRECDAGEASLERDCDLLTWVDGGVLKHGRGLGPRAAVLLGEGLGRLHNAAERFNPPWHIELPRWDAETMYSTASPFQPPPMDDFLSPKAWTLFQEVANRTQLVFKQLDAMPCQWGIVHNDYVLINCRFKRGARGWKLGILDFDDLGFGYFLYDLAPLLGNFSDYPSAYRRLRSSFLEGYRTVRPLSSALETHLPVLMAARHAATLTWLAAKQRRGETDIPIERHVAIRVSEMARCLALPGR
jgi:Ser/Thr protein kinase RdoA (MazF antagonist)